MKNRLLHSLILLLALLLLTACGRMDEEESSDAGTFSQGEQKADLYSLSFPLESFTSLTTQELLARGSKETEVYDEVLFNFLDTPLCIYGKRYHLEDDSGHTRYFVYDKRTGIFSDACHDPLCDHTTCLWGTVNGAYNIYRGANGLFFVCEDTQDDPAAGRQGRTQIYATDFLGDHAEQIFETAGRVLDLKQLGKQLWFSLITWDEEKEEDLTEVIRLNMETGRAETVLRSDRELVGTFFPLETAVLYQRERLDENGIPVGLEPSFYLRDPESGSDELFLQEEQSYTYIVGLYDDVLYYSRYDQETQQSTLYCRRDGGRGEEEVTEVSNSGAINWSADGIYHWERTESGGILYRENKEPYTLDVGYGDDGYLLDGDLFLYCYSVRATKAIHYWLMIDLKTGERLEVELP